MVTDLLVPLKCVKCGREYSHQGHWGDSMYCPKCSEREHETYVQTKKRYSVSRKGMGGRPSKYDVKFCDEIVRAAEEGKSEREFADSIGVHYTALAGWADEHEEFRIARELARDTFATWYEKTVKLGALGRIKDVNARLMMFYGKNILGWKDNNETQLTVQDRVVVSIGEKDAAAVEDEVKGDGSEGAA